MFRIINFAWSTQLNITKTLIKFLLALTHIEPLLPRVFTNNHFLRISKYRKLAEIDISLQTQALTTVSTVTIDNYKHTSRVRDTMDTIESSPLSDSLESKERVEVQLWRKLKGEGLLRKRFKQVPKDQDLKERFIRPFCSPNRDRIEPWRVVDARR